MNQKSQISPTGELTLRFPSGPVLQNISELRQPLTRTEYARHLRTARVILVHYQLVQHDFPLLRSEALAKGFPDLSSLPAPHRNRVENWLIDHWLLRNAALISERQIAQTIVNTPISAGKCRFRVFRPPLYGKAVVASLRQNRLARNGRMNGPTGLLDLKGVGVSQNRNPSHKPFHSGLWTVGQALTHLLYQELIDRVFEHTNAPYQTLPNYGLIDCGFDVRFKDGQTSPACITVRRAHRRLPGGGDLDNTASERKRIQLSVELLLRQYGITSCTSATGVRFAENNGQISVSQGSNNWQKLNDEAQQGLTYLPGYDARYTNYDGVNIQMTLETDKPRATLVDFGQYNVQQRFTAPLLSLAADQPLRWGGAILPENSRFVHPDPKLRPPNNSWGPVTPEELTGKPTEVPWTRPMLRCFELAAEWRDGRLSGVELRAELDTLLNHALSAILCVPISPA